MPRFRKPSNSDAKAMAQRTIVRSVTPSDDTWKIVLNLPGSDNPPAWLPRLDSNQDKENQNLLCYRYTTG